MAQKSLSSWSWQSLHRVYKTYGLQLGKYAAVDQRVKVPRKIDIAYPDSNNLFIIRFWRDVNRIDAHLKVMEKEIKRRNNLIGVMG